MNHARSQLGYAPGFAGRVPGGALVDSNRVQIRQRPFFATSISAMPTETMCPNPSAHVATLQTNS